MYYHHHQQQGHDILSSRSAFPQERHLFVQGGSLAGESGLVLSTDAKPRLKWTAELHERFIEAVNQLGGADKATPKTVMRLMGIPGLTLYHLKSHLQKYRLSKNLQAQANTGGTKSGCMLSVQKAQEPNGSFLSSASFVHPTNKMMPLNETLQMLEVQQRLHEQLEVQRHLQLRIEAQGKYLQSVLEKAQETIGKQNAEPAGLGEAKLHLSELVSKVSNDCLNSPYPRPEQIPGISSLHLHPSQHADCSVDSCLTSSEGSQKEHAIHDTGVNFDLYNSKQCRQAGDDKSEQIRPVWYRDLSEQKGSSLLTLREMKNSDKERSEESFRREGNGKKPVMRESNNVGLSCPSTQLDLNGHEDSEISLGCKQFDLNGFSWS